MVCVGLGLLGGCSSFEAAEPETTGGSGASMGVGSSTGTSTTANASDGSAEGATTDDPTSVSGTTGEPETSTTGIDASTSSSSSSGAQTEESSTGAELFPYAGDYAGTFSGLCVVDFNGTVTATVAPDGVITGIATVSGESTAVTGLVSNLGVVTGSLTILDFACTLAGTLEDDGSGGSGTFTCAAVSCTGSWSLTGV
jgi:hypothetical protein